MSVVRLSLIWASASWKNTIANLIKEEYWFVTPDHFTTRDRRDSEHSDDHYTYISQEEFISKIINKELDIFTYLEWVFYWYADSQESANRILYIIDPSGMPRLEKICLDNNNQLISIFLEVDDDLRIKRAKKRWWNSKLLENRAYMDNYLSILGKKYSQHTVKSVEWPGNTFSKVKALLDILLK